MKKRFVYIVLFFLLSFVVGFDFKCDDEEKDEIKVYITCYGGTTNTFSGIYFYNSDEAVEFDGVMKSSSLYTYSITFKDLDSVRFQVERDDDDNTLTIWTYRDGELLNDCTISIDSADTEVTVLNYYYDYDDGCSS